MNEELIEDKLKTYNIRLNNHGDRLDKLEQNDAKKEVQIANLIKSIDTLITILKCFITMFGSCIIGFFFYAIQTHLFK